MKTVVIGILGSRLDHQGLGQRRWNRWRPSISILLQDQFPVDKFLLLYHPNERQLAELTLADMRELRPGIEAIGYAVNYDDPWDFGQVYEQLHGFTREYEFDPERERYLVHITTGTHVAQICLFLLVEANFIPGQLLQTSPQGEQRNHPQGNCFIIDLNLTRYDQIAMRFEREAQEAIAYLKSGIATRNADFNALISQIEQVSIKSTAPILITGATGAGKSQLAKRIYELKSNGDNYRGV